MEMFAQMFAPNFGRKAHFEIRLRPTWTNGVPIISFSRCCTCKTNLYELQGSKNKSQVHLGVVQNYVCIYIYRDIIYYIYIYLMIMEYSIGAQKKKSGPSDINHFQKI